jgi:molecular chaperone HscC
MVPSTMDVTPFTLGVESTRTLGRHRVAGLFAPLLERGTALPASSTRRFWTVDHLQTTIAFAVYLGERPLCRDNTRISTFEVTDLEPLPAGEEAVDVTFTYDETGLLEIETVVLSTGEVETHRLTLLDR